MFIYAASVATIVMQEVKPLEILPLKNIIHVLH